MGCASSEDQLADAASAGDVGMINALVKKGAEVNSAVEYSRGGLWNTPLHRACANKHIDAIDALVAHGAIVNVSDFFGLNPLYYAAGNGAAGVVAALLRHGANPKIDCQGKTPLDRAVECNKTECVQLLEAALAEENRAVNEAAAASAVVQEEEEEVLEN